MTTTDFTAPGQTAPPDTPHTSNGWRPDFPPPDCESWEDYDADPFDDEDTPPPTEAAIEEMFRHFRQHGAQYIAADLEALEKEAAWRASQPRGSRRASADYHEALRRSAAADGVRFDDYISLRCFDIPSIAAECRALGLNELTYFEPHNTKRRERAADAKARRYELAMRLKSNRRDTSEPPEPPHDAAPETAPVADTVATRPATAGTAPPAALPVRGANVAQAPTGTSETVPHEATPQVWPRVGTYKRTGQHGNFYPHDWKNPDGPYVDFEPDDHPPDSNVFPVVRREETAFDEETAPHDAPHDAACEDATDANATGAAIAAATDAMTALAGQLATDFPLARRKIGAALDFQVSNVPRLVEFWQTRGKSLDYALNDFARSCVASLRAKVRLQCHE